MAPHDEIANKVPQIHKETMNSTVPGQATVPVTNYALGLYNFLSVTIPRVSFTVGNLNK